MTVTRRGRAVGAGFRRGFRQGTGRDTAGLDGSRIAHAAQAQLVDHAFQHLALGRPLANRHLATSR